MLYMELTHYAAKHRDQSITYIRYKNTASIVSMKMNMIEGSERGSKKDHLFDYVSHWKRSAVAVFNLLKSHRQGAIRVCLPAWRHPPAGGLGKGSPGCFPIAGTVRNPTLLARFSQKMSK